MEDVAQRLRSEEWDYIAPWSLLHQMYLTDSVRFPPGEPADCSDCCELLLATGISNRNLYVSSSEATGRGLKYGKCDNLLGVVVCFR